MAFVLGITGGIATGKTTVLGMFAGLDAHTVSADQIAREVLAAHTPAYRQAVEHFGQRILTDNGDIDRAALASIIFNDPEARKTLDGITHPPIIERVRAIIDCFRADHPSPRDVLAVEIPLLFECGLEDMVDQVLVVSAEQETQVSRLTTRSAASRHQALRGIAAQMPLEEKLRRADRVIPNDGSLQSLEQAVKSVWDEIRLL